jgi:hypothetical protein
MAAGIRMASGSVSHSLLTLSVTAALVPEQFFEK